MTLCWFLKALAMAYLGETGFSSGTGSSAGICSILGIVKVCHCIKLVFTARLHLLWAPEKLDGFQTWITSSVSPALYAGHESNRYWA